MSTTVINRNGVAMAGPDKAALAPEGSVVLAPVGAVSPAQAGMLDYLTPEQAARGANLKVSGTIAATSISGAVSVEMIDRAHAAAPGLDRGTVQDIVEAALGVRKHPLTD